MTSTPRNLRLLHALTIVAALATITPSLAIDTGGGGSSSGSSSSSAASGPTIEDARAFIKKGRWTQAISALKHVVSEEPRNADALNLLGYSLRKSGDMRNAEGFYLKALKIRPSHKGANEYLGELYVEVGQLDKARDRLKTLEGICGTSCEEYRDLKQAIDKAS